MDAIREALYDQITGAAGVTSLLGESGGVYHRRAPDAAVPPYVIFHRQSSTAGWTFGGERLDTELWLVKAVDHADSAAAAEAVAQALDAALNDVTLTIAGYTHLFLRLASKFDMGEEDGGRQFHHSGGLYRLAAQPD